MKWYQSKAIPTMAAAGRSVPGSNPEIKLEQWKTACVMIQELFAGKSVDEVMAESDALQTSQIAD